MKCALGSCLLIYPSNKAFVSVTHNSQYCSYAWPIVLQTWSCFFPCQTYTVKFPWTAFYLYFSFCLFLFFICILSIFFFLLFYIFYILVVWAHLQMLFESLHVKLWNRHLESPSAWIQKFDYHSKPLFSLKMNEILIQYSNIQWKSNFLEMYTCSSVPFLKISV